MSKESAFTLPHWIEEVILDEVNPTALLLISNRVRWYYFVTEGQLLNIFEHDLFVNAVTPFYNAVK